MAKAIQQVHEHKGCAASRLSRQTKRFTQHILVPHASTRGTRGNVSGEDEDKAPGTGGAAADSPLHSVEYEDAGGNAVGRQAARDDDSGAEHWQ